MPLIKPVSDLRNYPEVLKGVKVGQPVKNVALINDCGEMKIEKFEM